MHVKNMLKIFFAIFIILLFIPLTCFALQTQDEIIFYPTDIFEIPNYNGSINFANGGKCESASLYNKIWSFENLSLNNGFRLGTLNISAIDSDVTVLSIQGFGSDISGAILSYTVIGDGEQSFNFGIDANQGSWSVSFNDVFVAENSGWHILSDNTISIIGATSNVTLLYFVFPDFLGNNGDSLNKSFFQQHSVLIITAIIAFFAICLALLTKYLINNDQLEGV